MKCNRILIFLFVVFGFAACDKEEGSNPSNDKGAMSADVDGKAWNAKQGSVAAVIQQGLTNITGVAADGTVITITLKGSGVGQYKLEEGGDHAGVFALNTAGTEPAYTSNQGSDPTAYVKITEFNATDSTLSGEFQFTAFRLLDNSKKIISKGTFSQVRWKTEIHTGGSNSFKCKVDGQLFTGQVVTALVSGGSLLIVGSASSGVPSVGLNLNPNIGTGETQLEEFTGANYGQYSSATNYLTSSSGKVNISKHDKSARQISGTFEFEGEELVGSTKVSITEGQFSVKY